MGRAVARQEVEQKSAEQPLLWNAVCPFSRFFLQLKQDMCEDERTGGFWELVDWVTE